MKAAVLNQMTYALDFTEVETPRPGAGEVLVRLKAASLNHHELWSIKERSIAGSNQIIMGSDGAGEIVETASDVDGSWVGKGVIINPSLNWGISPKATGPDYEILGFPTNGTFAEYLRISAGYVHPKPTHLSFEEAAALPLAGLTAYRALFTKGQVQKGDKVLITGIGGGAALFALQFAVAAGAQVYVTSGSQQKIDAAVKAGAKNGAIYTADGWDKELREMAGEFDLIVDSAAGPGFAHLAELAAFGGKIVLFGRTAGMISNLNPRTVFWKQLSILGTTMGRPEEFSAMLEFVNHHRIRPVIDAVFPLSQINEGFERMAASGQFGKIVVLTSSRG